MKMYQMSGLIAFMYLSEGIYPVAATILGLGFGAYSLYLMNKEEKETGEQV